MAAETQTAEGQIQDQGQTLDSDQSQSTENQGQTLGSDSSSEQTASEKADKRIAALEARLSRESERNDALEQSLKLQERFFQRQGDQGQQGQGQGNGQQARQSQSDSPELDILDKALDPLFERRFKKVLEPLQQVSAQQAEVIDAMDFERYIQRHQPELLDDEGSYGKVLQQVANTRQHARDRLGINLTRIDALMYNEGIESTRRRVEDRKQKHVSSVGAETKRQAEVKAAQGTTVQGEPRRTASGDIHSIRDKASRGERLTTDERAKYREFVSGVVL